jgi:hypothetical protein
MEIKKGMTLKIKTYDTSNIPSFWNREKMPKYMGMLVTIRCPSTAGGYPKTFHIEEDVRDRSSGWHWRDIDFVKANTLGDK